MDIDPLGRLSQGTADLPSPANCNHPPGLSPEALYFRAQAIRYAILAIKAYLAGSEAWMRATSAMIRRSKRDRAFAEGRARLVHRQTRP
jgi:hypothetical protein